MVASQETTKQNARAQTAVTPTLYCLAADCPGTNVSSSPIPTLTVSGAVSPQPQVKTPCANAAVSQSISHPDQKKSHHHQEGGFLKGLFQFLLLFIELILKVSGGGALPCAPSTTPMVTVIPSTAPQAVTSTAPTVSGSPQTDGTKTPNQILNLSNWNLTLPVGDPTPTTITADQLAGGYQDQYFHVSDDGSGVIFNAPVAGTTTQNSTHTRSELRETDSNGKTPWVWSTTTGNHVMTATEAITHLPGGPGQSGRLGFAQIHGDNGTWYLILEADDNNDGTATLKVHDQTKLVDGTVIDDKYVLGTKFDLVFTANNGNVTVDYNGSQKVVTTSTLQDAYFKIGAYNQSAGDYGEVEVYSINVTHN